MEIACTPGCAFCCYIPVVCSEREARAALDVATSPGRVKRRAKAHRGRDFEPCPFLDLATKRCVAYEARPHACRGYTSFDREACETAHHRRKHNAPIPADGETYARHLLAAQIEAGPKRHIAEWIRSF